MVDFKKGIYTDNFEFEDTDGVKQVIVLKPLPAKFLKQLLRIITTINKKQGSDKEFNIDILDDQVVGDLIEVCDETMKKSYPSLSDEERDLFVTSHFLRLFPAILNLNLKDRR